MKFIVGPNNVNKKSCFIVVKSCGFVCDGYSFKFLSNPCDSNIEDNTHYFNDENFLDELDALDNMFAPDLFSLPKKSLEGCNPRFTGYMPY